MTNVEAKRLLAILAVAYPRDEAFLDPEIAKARDTMYLVKFTPLSFAGMMAVVDTWVTTETRYPTLADLLNRRREALRPRPELYRNASLPPVGETIATPAEVRATVAKAVAALNSQMKAPKVRPARDPESTAARKAAEESLAAMVGKLPAPGAA